MQGVRLPIKKRLYIKELLKRFFMAAKKGSSSCKSYDWIPINTEYLKVVYDDLVMSQGVSVLFFSNMAAVEMKNKETVDAIIVANKSRTNSLQGQTVH